MKLLRLFLVATLVFQFALANGQLQSKTQPLPLVPPKRRALVIGVSNYKSLGVLDFAADDAAKITNILIEKFRFTRDTIRFLSDKSPEQGAKPDGPATAASIRQELKKLLAEPGLNKSDLFLLYFSGHGVGTAKGDFLCPADATLATVESAGVPVEEVVTSFVKAGLKNVLIIADACRSGQSNKFGGNLIDLGKKANLGILLGCAPGQRSYEYPDLGGGAFTYFLAKSLKDESIRTPYGVLWASKIAESVAKKVKSYTEKDYGDAAQVPTAWADGATDILVGAYPPKTWSENNLKAFESDAKVLDKARYQAATLELANSLATDQKYGEMIDLLKALAGIGADSDESNFLLACALGSTGRLVEANRLFQKIITTGELQIFKDRSTAISQSREISPLQKVVAAQSIWQEEKDQANAALLWAVARNNAQPEELIKILKRLIDQTSISARIHWLCLGDLHFMLNQPLLAISEYDEALKRPYELGSVSNATIRTNLYPILEFYGSAEQRDQIIKDALDDPETKSYWLARKAYEMKQRGEHVKARELALDAAKGDSLNAIGMEFCILATGAECKVLASDFERLAKLHPYDWKSQLCLAVVHSIRDGGKNTEDELNNLDRYADDVIEVRKEAYPLLDSILEDAVDRFGLERDKLSEVQLSNYKELRVLANQFGSDNGIWLMFAAYGVTNEYSRQAHWLFKKFGLPLVKLRTLGTNGVAAGYLIATSVGDYPLAESMYRDSSLLEPDRTSLALNWATLLLLQGRYSEVGNILSQLPAPVWGNQDLVPVLRAYLDAIKGSTAKLEKLDVGKNPSIQGVAGIAWAKLGNWKRAEPLLQFAADKLNWMNTPLKQRCAELLIDRLRINGKLSAADNLAYRATLSYSGSVAQHGIHFGDKPVLADFIGQRTLNFNWASDKPYDPKNPVYQFEIDNEGCGQGSMIFSVSSSGKAKLVISKKNAVSETFVGKIDANGNLKAIGPQGADLIAKLIPNKLLSQAEYRSPGQYFTVMTPEGTMERFFAKPSSPQKQGPTKKKKIEMSVFINTRRAQSGLGPNAGHD